jgi:hypothetical protein
LCLETASFGFQISNLRFGILSSSAPPPRTLRLCGESFSLDAQEGIDMGVTNFIVAAAAAVLKRKPSTVLPKGMSLKKNRAGSR